MNGPLARARASVSGRVLFGEERQTRDDDDDEEDEQEETVENRRDQTPFVHTAVTKGDSDQLEKDIHVQSFLKVTQRVFISFLHQITRAFTGLHTAKCQEDSSQN